MSNKLGDLMTIITKEDALTTLDVLVEELNKGTADGTVLDACVNVLATYIMGDIDPKGTSSYSDKKENKYNN